MKRVIQFLQDADEIDIRQFKRRLMGNSAFVFAYRFQMPAQRGKCVSPNRGKFGIMERYLLQHFPRIFIFPHGSQRYGIVSQDAGI